MYHVESYPALSTVLRACTMAPLAALITVLLIVLMQLLITSEQVEIPVAPDYNVPNVVMPKPLIEIIIKVEPPKRVEVKQKPQIEPIIEPKWKHNNVRGALPASYEPSKISGISVPSNREPIAKLMVAPDYPYHAVRRGIEGYVDVRFDVTKYGATTNISILRSIPEKVFDKAALASIKRWKFTPFIANGEESPYQGMTRRVRFELKK